MSEYYRAVAAERSDHVVQARRASTGRTRWRLAAADVDAVVWGQSSVGFDLDTESWARDRLLALARELDRPVLVNVDARRPNGRISKTMVVVRPDGLGETYTKQRLVPFGEYIPLRLLLGWVAGFSEAAEEDRVPGTGLTTVRLGDATVGPLISYESTFPDMRCRRARAGVDLTLVPAAATTFQGTWALPQQASFEAVRPVESGRPAVLVAVSGTLAAFDARGRRLAWVDQHETGAWTVAVPLSQEETPFVRWGDWVPAACFVVAVVAALAACVPVGHWRQHRAPSRPVAKAHRELGASAAPLARSAPRRRGAAYGGGRVCAVQPVGGAGRCGGTLRRPR